MKPLGIKYVSHHMKGVKVPKYQGKPWWEGINEPNKAREKRLSKEDIQQQLEEEDEK